MAIANSKRHALDGKTYHRISNQIPIRDPMGSPNPEASGVLITTRLPEVNIEYLQKETCQKVF